MTTLAPPSVRRLVAAAALVALAVAPGCDWLKSSGPGTRSSPVLSSLNVGAAAVGTRCGSQNEFEISFRYDDPQDDIFSVTLTFTHPESQTIRERMVLWSQMDLTRDPGWAFTTFFFDCGRPLGGDPEGQWILTVQAEDAEGHVSNVLTREITLLS